MPTSTVLIASDHAGFELKAQLQKLIPEIQWVDLGPTTNARVDYPDFAEKLGHQLIAKAGGARLGVLICGSGVGMCIAANKIAGIRAASVQDLVAARLSREHNDANVLCLGARFMASEYATEVVRTFLNAASPADKPHEPGNDRHLARIAKIRTLESK